MVKLRKGDLVQVLTGKDRGARGKILRVVNDRIVVQGVNVCTKHVKPNPMKGVEGGIERRECSVHISNVALCPSPDSKGGRVSFKLDLNGVKRRSVRGVLVQ